MHEVTGAGRTTVVVEADGRGECWASCPPPEKCYQREHYFSRPRDISLESLPINMTV